MEHYSEWPEEKKQRARDAHRRWKERNKEKRSTYYKQYDSKRTVAEKLFRSMKNRKTYYDITVADIIVPELCPICHCQMKPSIIRGGSSFSPTLDKIAADEGYTKGNIAVICKKCNSDKGDASAEKHRQIAEWMDLMKKS